MRGTLTIFLLGIIGNFFALAQEPKIEPVNCINMSDEDKYPPRTQVGGTEKSDVDKIDPLTTKHVVTGFTAC